MRPGRIAPAHSGLPPASDARVALIVFCFFLPGDERPPSRAARFGATDLDFGAVQADDQSFGAGVGEQVGQGVQALTRACGETAIGQQRAHLGYRFGHRGAFHAVQDRDGLVRQGKA
jgi:hypothetical protein